MSAYPSPANGDKRKHVGKLLETVAVKTGKTGRPRKNVRRLAADKGYDADALRNFLKKKGIQPPAADSKKKECSQAVRRPMGKIAELFRRVFLVGSLFFFLGGNN